MKRVEFPRKGEPITEEWGRSLVDAVNDAAMGPEVASPLVKVDGVVGLGQDFQLWVCKTTGAIAARQVVSGKMTWGSGTASFYTVDPNGVESVMPGYESVTVWNYFGAPIASGIRVEVSYTYGKWLILGGDCSGVA